MPQSPHSVVGLDIGGANLKAALATGCAQTVPFALWKAPAELPERLRRLLAELPHDALAVTMTGELCDCFPTKRAGVAAILDAVAQAGPGMPVGVWSTAGRLISVSEANAEPHLVASANWHALATWAARLLPRGPALLIDVGSTTTDLIPLLDGRPAPRGLTDPDRLAGGELVYTGARRTPLCAILGRAGAAELFATTLDIHLLLGLIPDAPHDVDTADGRPATREHAHARLARMVCDDAEGFPYAAALALAQRIHERQIEHLAAQVGRVTRTLPGRAESVIVAGAGEFLARIVCARALPTASVVSLAERWSGGASTAACAQALALLAT